MIILKGRFLDVESGSICEDGLVAFENDTILYAGEAAGFAAPPEAQVFSVPAPGTILPGFIDLHAHLTGREDAGSFADGRLFGDQLLGGVRQLQLLLESGFTGIRDMSEAGLYLSRGVERGVLTGPRIVPGGRVLGITSGHIDMDPSVSKAEFNRRDHLSFLIDGADDCVRGVREQFRLGAKFIKICATGGVSSAIDDVNDQEFSEEELKVIIGEAKRHNTYVTAHCTGTAGTKAALLAGIGCVEHGVMLDEECCRIMKERNIPLVTTLSVALGLADMKDLPPHIMRKAQGVKEAAMRSFRLAREYGITVALGTDYSNSPNTPYREIGREFYSLTRCGYTPMEAIKAGTVNGAKLMRREKEIGTVEAGKLADLVLVQGNPLEEIRVLASADNIRMVLIGGKIQKLSDGVRHGI